MADPSAGRTGRRPGVRIGAIVLAAGSSSRLGQAKQLLTYGGKTFVRLSAQAAIEAGCAPVIAVLGSEREKIASELRDLPVTMLTNENWERGVGSSLRAGMAAAATACDAVVILTCDQPHVSATVLQRLIAAHKTTTCPIVASTYARTRGVPALFARACFPALQSLPDARGAKSIIATAREAEIALIDFPEGAIDIDTPQDYERL
jgi:molybdenum cofactor cytidylyltransferase